MSRNGVLPWMKGMPAGLQDMYTRLEVRNEPHWDVVDPNRPVRPMKDVVAAKIVPCAVPGMESIQKVIDCQLVPRWMQMLLWFKQQLKCGTYHIQPPPYQVPSATALCLDEFTDPGVDIGPGATDTLLDFTIPDRFAGFVWRMGQALDPGDAWGGVTFNWTVDGAPVRCYGQIAQQLGIFNDPTLLGAPTFLKHLSRILVTATNNTAADVQVFFRLQGWILPLKEVTDDGSFKKWHVT